VSSHEEESSKITESSFGRVRSRVKLDNAVDVVTKVKKKSINTNLNTNRGNLKYLK
jgi:hypothetical protein